MPASIQQQRLARDVRLKIERLYLTKGLNPNEIASQLGLQRQTVSNVVYKHGLVERRRAKEARVFARVEDRAAAEAEDFIASVTPQAMEEAEGGFEMSRQARAEGDAKAFAMAAKGTQIMVQIARQGLGLDRPGSGGSGGTSTTLVFARFGNQDPAEKPAEAVDVEAEQVGEDVTLDFDESQQAFAIDGESDSLIGSDAQPAGNGIADTRSLNKP